MKTRIFGAFVMIGFLTIPFLASAEEQQPPGPPGEPQKGAVMKRFRAIRIAELQEALNLDEKTTIRLNELLIKHDRERDGLKKEIHDNLRELKTLMDSEKPDSVRISKNLDKLTEIRNKFHNIQTAQLKEVRQLLTPIQQAKFVLKMEQFHKNMRQAIKKSWMERGPGGAKGPGPNGPGMGPEMGPPEGEEPE